MNIKNTINFKLQTSGKGTKLKVIIIRKGYKHIIRSSMSASVIESIMLKKDKQVTRKLPSQGDTFINKQ